MLEHQESRSWWRVRKRSTSLVSLHSCISLFIHSTNTCWLPAMKWTGVSKSLVLVCEPPRSNVIVHHWKINMMIMCCVNWLGVLSLFPSLYHSYFTIQGSFRDFILVFFLFCVPVFLKEHFVGYFFSAWWLALSPFPHFTPSSWSWAELDLPCSWSC